MDKIQLTYIVFTCVIFLALLFDLGLLSKKQRNFPGESIAANCFLGIAFFLPFVVLFGTKILVETGRKMLYNIYRPIYWSGL